MKKITNKQKFINHKLSSHKDRLNRSVIKDIAHKWVKQDRAPSQSQNGKFIPGYYSEISVVFIVEIDEIEIDGNR